MASETPKKLVDTDKCFACPTILQKKETVRLFGESKVGGRDVASTLTSAKEAIGETLKIIVSRRIFY
jgi:hypothetical protein